jgi:hypothetical protein
MIACGIIALSFSTGNRTSGLSAGGAITRRLRNMLDFTSARKLQKTRI